MSPRHFTRVFRSEVGMSPARYVEQVRLETARRRLEESQLSVEAIAAGCGFGSAETLRRVFVQTLGVSPAEYRRRFGGTAAQRRPKEHRGHPGSSSSDDHPERSVVAARAPS